MKAILILCLIFTSSLASYYSRGPERKAVPGLVKKIQRALQNRTPIQFNITDEQKDSLCVNWSIDEECTAVGRLSELNFNKIKGHFNDLEEIPFCLVYNNFFGCDLCESGRAFNGNECAPCAHRTTMRGSEAKHECEYPWKGILNNSLYSGSSNNRRTGLGYLYSSCIMSANSKNWDGCLRARAGRKYPVPRQLSPGTTPGRNMINYHRTSWRQMPFDRRVCSAYNFFIPWCNCKSTVGRDTCSDCDEDFLMKGKVEGRGSSRFDNEMDVDVGIYTGYVCVPRKQQGTGCKVLRHNMDQAEDHACLICDYRNGYRMSKDGYCVMSE